MLRPTLKKTIKKSLIPTLHGGESSSWYNKTTGMVICSDKLIECNNEVIPCL